MNQWFYPVVRQTDDILIITFDVIYDFEEKDRPALHQQICEEIREAYPDYDISIAMDVDISD